MTLDMPKKITLGILAIIVIFAGIQLIPQVPRFKKIPQNNRLLFVDKMSFEKKYKQLSIQFKAYPEFFESETPILVYGYISRGISRQQSDIFHKKLTKALTEKNIQYKVVAIENWPKTKNAIDKKYFNSNNLSCSTITKDQELLLDYLDFATDCLSNACIIDKNKNEYILIDRNIDHIIQVLNGETRIYSNTQD